MPPARKIPIDVLLRVCRLYRRDADAAAALGINERTFTNMCKELGIKTPNRRRRERYPPAT